MAKQDPVPGYDNNPDAQKSAAALYADAALGLPEDGTYVLVLSSKDCPICKKSMVNTRFANKTTNGTDMFWIDMTDPSWGNIQLVKNIRYDDKSGKLTIMGSEFLGTPTTLMVRNGEAVAVKRGEIASIGELDGMVAQSQAQAHLDAGASGPKVCAPSSGSPFSLPAASRTADGQNCAGR